MRRVLTAFVLVVPLVAGPALAGQDEERIYDAQGRYQGRATPDAANPRQKSLYDEHGAYKGRVTADDQGNTRIYDNNGKYLGRTTGGSVPGQKK